MDSRELPKYECHKKVWALKIKAIEPKIDSSRYGLEAIIHNGATITPAEEGYAPFEVDQAYINKHSPKVGGYYVVYADGYKSFSPADAFENGYTLIAHTTDTGGEA